MLASAEDQRMRVKGNCCFSAPAELTVSRPAGVALRAVTGVDRGDGGHAGAADKAKGGKTAGGAAAARGVSRRTQARLAAFGEQIFGAGDVRLGCCRDHRGGDKNLIC